MLTAEQRTRITRRCTYLQERIDLRAKGGLPDRAGHDRAELSALEAALEELDAWRAAYPGVKPPRRLDAYARAAKTLAGDP